MTVNTDISRVQKFSLDNGMTILVRPVHTIPKVSLQLWYNVGSKDEQDKERGIAHLIEHMIFKGTDTLSESDIDTISHKLSGSINAFTSYDYTGYLFNFPKQHWHEALPIMADCMLNCAFKSDMLNSEMKAVIQELKMFKDNYVRSLVDEMIAVIFTEHPYHHPIIGYKQDLWSVTPADLKSFYKKHYGPHNATLVVTGDVDPQDVYKRAQQMFGHIPANPDYKKVDHYRNEDIVAKTVTLYRDVQQPSVLYTFVVPGTREKKDSVLDFLAWILGRGKSSRLYKKLVDELQLATSLDATAEDLFDYGLFFIAVHPKSVEDIDKIEKIIVEEILDIAQNGVTDKEINRAIKQAQMGLYSLLENIENQAYEIGKYYLATGDENYVFDYLQGSPEEFKKEIQKITQQYLRPVVMHKGLILPLPEQEKIKWAELQAQSDKQDEEILSLRPRTSKIEPPVCAERIEVKDPEPFPFLKAHKHELSNGLKILWAHNGNIPTIDFVIDFKVKHYYDPEDKQGLGRFVAKMLLEGTQKYSAQELAEIVESRGMEITSNAGGMSMNMLAEDASFGLDILHEIVTNATFPETSIEKVRQKLLSNIKQFWDDSKSIASQLTREEIYKGHPYSKNSLGTARAINSITRQDLVDYYKKYISPHGTRIAIVGDTKSIDVQKLVSEKLGSWKGPEVEGMVYPTLANMESRSIDYPINRDQVVLTFAGLSISRKDPSFDQLLLFDQIFGGGMLSSMSSRLFKLREQSGLFYTISGSLLASATEEPGMMLVRTIVSLDRLKEAEKVIKDTIENIADTLTEQELLESKRAIANSLIDYFASNESIAGAFLYLDKYNFSTDFFDKRAQVLASITLEEVKQAVKKMLKNDKLVTLRVGRV